MLSRRDGVPEFDAAIRGAASTRKQATLMWGPCDGLYCSLVTTFLFTPAMQPAITQTVPDEDLVVVTTRCQLICIAVPAQAADFLLVADKLSKVLLR
jgi:hypothetical protein